MQHEAGERCADPGPELPCGRDRARVASLEAAVVGERRREERGARDAHAEAGDREADRDRGTARDREGHRQRAGPTMAVPSPTSRRSDQSRCVTSPVPIVQATPEASSGNEAQKTDQPEPACSASVITVVPPVNARPAVSATTQVA